MVADIILRLQVLLIHHWGTRTLLGPILLSPLRLKFRQISLITKAIQVCKPRRMAEGHDGHHLEEIEDTFIASMVGELFTGQINTGTWCTWLSTICS